MRTLTLGVIEDFKFKFKFKTDLTMGLGGGRPPIKAAPLRSHLALSVTVSLKCQIPALCRRRRNTRHPVARPAGLFTFSRRLEKEFK